MSTTTRPCWHGQLVRRVAKPAHTLTVRFLTGPVSTPPAPAPGPEEPARHARAMADGDRRPAAVAGRPARQIQLTKFAEAWAARDAEPAAKVCAPQTDFFSSHDESRP